ncbi:hypothetical protein ARMSODRAFT_1040813 [Armillaria solidipes]|uniref:Uncharacterized protein n=1 Tax=Armillaria solidipes TaxID=1076256 RepID=A0A2H3BBU2_9AGAR|nr:hypothetical protein ARMSODRAFT_1040813 [Armillaria solidipes]
MSMKEFSEMRMTDVLRTPIARLRSGHRWGCKVEESPHQEIKRGLEEEFLFARRGTLQGFVCARMVAVGWRGRSETPITASLPSPTVINDYGNPHPLPVQLANACMHATEPLPLSMFWPISGRGESSKGSGSTSTRWEKGGIGFGIYPTVLLFTPQQWRCFNLDDCQGLLHVDDARRATKRTTLGESLGWTGFRIVLRLWYVLKNDDCSVENICGMNVTGNATMAYDAAPRKDNQLGSSGTKTPFSSSTTFDDALIDQQRFVFARLKIRSTRSLVRIDDASTYLSIISFEQTLARMTRGTEFGILREEGWTAETFAWGMKKVAEKLDVAIAFQQFQGDSRSR